MPASAGWCCADFVEPAADLHPAAGADQGQARLMTVFQGAVDASFNKLARIIWRSSVRVTLRMEVDGRGSVAEFSTGSIGNVRLAFDLDLQAWIDQSGDLDER
jgi:hypothetical protein